MTVQGWDEAVVRLLAERRTGWGDALTRALMDTFADGRARLAVAVLTLLVTVALGWYRQTAALLLGGGTALLLCSRAKERIGRPRPPDDLALVEALGSAMPSTSAALTASVGAALVVLASRERARWSRWLPGAVLAVVLGVNLLIGVSVVYLGAHWPSDVLAGWALGAAVGAAAALVLAPRRRVALG